MPTPEDKARENIDRLLTQAGWAVRDQSDANILAYRGVAIRNFTLKPGHGFADYLLYVDGRAAGVIEAKKEGVTLTGVETQSERYTKGLPDKLPAWSKPLPFSYESTGIETRFTNGLDSSRALVRSLASTNPRLWLNGLKSVLTCKPPIRPPITVSEPARFSPACSRCRRLSTMSGRPSRGRL
jgi:type I restriction enzyme, R subunit